MDSVTILVASSGKNVALAKAFEQQLASKSIPFNTLHLLI